MLCALFLRGVMADVLMRNFTRCSRSYRSLVSITALVVVRLRDWYLRLHMIFGTVKPGPELRKLFVQVLAEFLKVVTRAQTRQAHPEQ